MQWDIFIGLETHVQLQTKSKSFSAAATDFGEPPNTQACAVSLALPGVLPVLNQEAVDYAIRFGLAVQAQICERSVFARKHYFYPDLPKGYQISQYELPLISHGSLRIPSATGYKDVRILRAHLEEDAGKLIHGMLNGMSGVDLNRAGIPLLEIVTEPDMNSATEAVNYTKKLHNLVQWLGICDGNMQEGSFRCDVNVSVRPHGSTKLGTRREIKNLNSFRFIQQAIEFESRWQIETLEDGGHISQSTVLFDPDTGETRTMRSKEEANDYRYFPDPDLLPLHVSPANIERIQASMPELPEVVQTRLVRDYGLSDYDALELTSSRAVADYFFATVSAGAEAKLVANWMQGALFAKLNVAELPISAAPLGPATLAVLISRIKDGSLSNSAAKQVFETLWQEGGDVDSIIAQKGLQQVSDSDAIGTLVDKVMTKNPEMVAEFKAGKEKAFNALVGQVMKVSQGRANPTQVNDILRLKLGEQ